MADNTPIDRSVEDDLGPIKVVRIYDPITKTQGIVVVDNVACGPSIGGIRMAPDVTEQEVFRLARAMTLKNAAAGLPHGGGKAGIVADPSADGKERTVRAFARAIRDLHEYIPGPDMGTDETAMAWILDEIGRVVGLPRVLGGIPLDELGATGFGIAVAAEVAAPYRDVKLEGARVAIEGYGNVGYHAARFLEERGAVLVAASDSKGAVSKPGGIDSSELQNTRREKGSVVHHPNATRMKREELLTVDCDILVPAARPDSIHGDNAKAIQAKLILQGANIPATAEAEAILHERGVLVVPDFIANAGGVICASVEFHGGTEKSAFEQIESKIRRNTAETLERCTQQKTTPRDAAVAMAKERVQEAMTYRRAT